MKTESKAGSVIKGIFGTILVVFGSIFALFALVSLIAGVGILTDTSEDKAALVAVAIVMGIVMGIASIMLFFGIRMLLNRKPYRRKMREKIESERIRKEEEEREKREREKMIADSIFQERIIYAQIQEIEAQERLEYLRAEARKKLEQQRIEQEKAAEEKRKWRAERDVSRVDGMEGHEFEYFCADLLTRNGFSDISVTRGSGDQGVDILARKEGIKYAIQCKNYASKLGNTPVQEVNTGKIFYNCHIGIVLTNSTFTPSAQQLADSTGVLLWDREKLQQLMLDAK